MEALKRILDLPLIGILRGFNGAQIREIIPAVIRGGLRNLEITMNSPGAAALIRQAVEIAGGSLNIGAGTVTTTAVLREALNSGATFIVTPALNRDVIRVSVGENVPVFPGAFSPSEICEAWEMGVAMVKIFPAEFGGPAYVRSLRGPFPQIKLLPTGGVDVKTAPEFMKAGANGLGVGSPLFDRSRIEAGDWQWMEDQTRRFVAVLRGA
jgi:2-dehydro-3-deoxyphosphogluconate aldolase/(4S)-4-hydroxy-2-oxoglutarate aldolase